MHVERHAPKRLDAGGKLAARTLDTILVGPENSCRLIMLKIFFRTTILHPYEPHFIFHDRFPEGRFPLPTFPTA